MFILLYVTFNAKRTHIHTQLVNMSIYAVYELHTQWATIHINAYHLSYIDRVVDAMRVVRQQGDFSFIPIA